MEPPVEAATEVADVVAEVEAEEPPTPSHKKTREEPVERPVPTLDADFWSGMLVTKREMDREAKKARYSNLVVFK
jgi:hypothetical protein